MTVTVIERTWQSPDAIALERLGGSLGRAIEGPALILLFGTLGAGKTTLTRGIASGLDAATYVQSPTFALIYEYSARIPIAHMDFYRLTEPGEIDGLGIEEYLNGPWVTVIEWPELALSVVPGDRLEVRISDDGAGRRVEARGVGTHGRLVERWTAEAGIS